MALRSRSVVRLLAGLALALGLTLVGGAVLADTPPGKVTHTLSGDTEIWRIDEPDVSKRILEFPQIQFTPGDKVTVRGGGCVQTGGAGATWKRYVDPLGPDSDRLYHGMVMIPGAIGALPATTLDNFARILIDQGHTFTVAAITEPRRAHLYLGYEDGDGDYGDNGYWGQDAGTQGQCRIGNGWVEHAYVIVTIVHGGAPPPPANAKPFDLSANTITPDNPAVDPNEILLNPVWASQLAPGHPLPNPFTCDPSTRPSDPADCTRQTTTWDGAAICTVRGWFSGDAGGHLNWAAGTYRGRIYWEAHSTPGTDDDYNLRIVPPDAAGLTTTNGKTKATGEPSIEIEFDSDETIDHFSTPWWVAFHAAVDADDSAYSSWQGAITDKLPPATITRLQAEFAGAHARLLGKVDHHQAIVVGLVGLDEAHCCATELHPVWALAIQVKDDPDDEVWEIFVRRWGNEGFCSGDQHYLDDLRNDALTLRIPAPAGATGVAQGPATVFLTRQGEGRGPDLRFVAGQGADVTFAMPAPQNGTGERMHGELHLRWTGVAKILHRRLPVEALSAGRIHSLETDDARAAPDDETIDDGAPESLVRAAIEALPTAQRPVYLAHLPARDLSADVRPPRPIPPLAASAGQASRDLPRIAAHRPPTTRAVPDPAKQARDQQRLAAFRSVSAQVIQVRDTPPPGHPATPILKRPREAPPTRLTPEGVS